MKDVCNKLLKYRPIIFLDHLVFRIGEDHVPAIGAQLAYFLILSLFPFLIVLLNILSYTDIFEMEFIYQGIQYLPLDIQKIINSFINDLSISSSQGLLSIALFAGIWTAASGVTPVIRAINKAYDYIEKRSFIKLKALSILFTIMLIVLILLVFIALVFGEMLGRELFDFFGLSEMFLATWTNIRIIIPILFMIYIFALLYKFSPCAVNRKEHKLIKTLPGAVFATLGWMFVSLLFSYYVNNFGKYSTTYGSLGGVIVLLVWLYLGSIIIVLGGELNASISFFKKNGLVVNREKSLLCKLIK